jgi:uncharacterized protein (TIGR02444 family)
VHNLQKENDFWNFSLTSYGKPGVAEACLILQNRHEVNINTVLYCLWLARKERSFCWDKLQTQNDIDLWHQQQVLPLRQLRLLLKDTAEASQAQKYYYESLKKEELEAEQVEQAMLFELAAEMPLVEEVGIEKLALKNLESYAQRAMPESEELKPLLDKLIKLVV